MADNNGILSILECPVCFEYMVPPIYQCHNQHLICSYCEKKQTHCPICRVKLSGVRSLCMEKVTEYISYPCKNEEIGCNAKLRLYEKEDHEQTCLQNGKHHCLLPVSEENASHCVWIGPYEEVDGHIRQTHGHLINNSPDGSFSSTSCGLMDFQYYILFDDSLFCILIHKEPLRTSSIQKVYTFFFHIVTVTCGQEKYYAYNVRIAGQVDAFEGFVGKMVSHTDIKDMASRHECPHFMEDNQNITFQGNIVKI